MKNQKIVVLSGAGVSAESGINTFRDSDGLWEGHDVMAVASPEGWFRNPVMVLDFYNQRRKRLLEVEPNDGHKLLAQLEAHYDVTIITQNVDDLHERAGSSHVIHLHGELRKARSTSDEKIVYEMSDWEMHLGDMCELGSQLRPHIVWFGEAVPMMGEAIAHVSEADICIVVGTSLQVYPAAGLVDYAPRSAPLYVVDPRMPLIQPRPHLHLIEEKATVGLQQVYQELMALA